MVVGTPAAAAAAPAGCATVACQQPCCLLYLRVTQTHHRYSLICTLYTKRVGVFTRWPNSSKLLVKREEVT